MAVFRTRRRFQSPMTQTKAIFFAFVITVALTIQSLVWLEKRLEPTLLILASEKAEQLAKQAISDAVTKRIAQQGVDFNEIVHMEKDRNGRIQAVDFNFKEYSRIVGEASYTIEI